MILLASVLFIAGFISLKGRSVDMFSMSADKNINFPSEVKANEENKLQYKDIKEKDVNDNKTEKRNNDNTKYLGEFEMTAYTAYCDGCIGITKTGYDVRNTIYYDGMRIVAVDPDVIDLYSKLKITMPDGEVLEAIALDTGGAIKGKRLDLLVENRKKARVDVGRKRVRVELIK